MFQCKKSFLFFIAFICVIAPFLVPPIAQDLAYHDFADKRAWLGVPNAGDVLGNLAFVIAGFYGFWHFLRLRKPLSPLLQITWGIFFGGSVLVGIGSGYYHLAPDNATLVWDRLPMTICFMSFFAAIIAERLGEKTGKIAFPLLLAIGAFSVFYWDYTEGLNRGDLRLYAAVQFAPPFIMLAIFSLFPATHSGTRYIMHGFGWYLLAKITEHFDRAIFAMTDGIISGHTIKHVAAAGAVFAMLGYFNQLSARRTQ